MEAFRLELQEREKVWKNLQGIRVWLEAADGLLSEMERSSSTQELQVGHTSASTSLYQDHSTTSVGFFLSNSCLQDATSSERLFHFVDILVARRLETLH